MQLKDVGEFNFIRHIQENTINDASTVITGIGDDCAVYSTTDKTDQLISTDTMVEGVHFSFHYMMPYDVGYRLMTANLSDIAAMGGMPRQIVLSVAVPEHIDTAILDEIYRGIKDQCKRYHLNILGGDTVRTEGPMVWTVTIIGDVPTGTAIMRSGAKVGDAVGITNYVGYAATGLGALSYNLEGYHMTKVGHQRPDPQIELGQQLRQLGIHSMNDISDGLGSELNEIATASNVSIVIEEQAIPLHEETYELAQYLHTHPVDYALYGGEDFQLVFTAPKSLLPELEKLGGITIIGEVVSGPSQVQMVTPDKMIKTIEAKGYNHFHES
ncbi:thiamine-phosphate kinase [uncultured Veillonella sp.]|uniref:thiamine-phosphate kinase n=1 Tax=uncultured Veillonella sp. TaxID=159268 RepID=UPI00344EA74A